MPRKPRFQLPGVPQHVIQRGDNRQTCFYGKNDYHIYLDALLSAIEKYQCQIYACVLMTKHLLVTPLITGAIANVSQPSWESGAAQAGVIKESFSDPGFAMLVSSILAEIAL